MPIQFTAGNAAYFALGKPLARELVYAEQDAPTTSFVIFRTRYATATIFERISMLLEGTEWRIAAWMLSPAS